MPEVSGPWPKYVSLAQAAAIASLSSRTLRRAVAAGRLRAHRLGRLIRIDVVELRRWMEADSTPVVRNESHKPAADH